MFFYPFYQWLLFFLLYCFLGWIWETSYVSVKEKHFVNRGFMYGTAIPIYGFGAIAMLIATLPFKSNLVAVYFVGLIAATVLELFTGLAMEKIFKVKYWDYSSQKFNFKGYICLSSSLFWGLLSVVLVKWIHSFFEEQLNKIPVDTQYAILITAAVVFLTDLGLSIKAALDLRKVIVKMEKLKKEMDRIREELSDKLDATRDAVSDKIESTVDAVSDRIESTVDAVSDRIESTVDVMSDKLDATKDAVSDRLDAMGDKIEATRDAMSDRLDATKDAISDRLDATRDAMSGRLDATKDAISDRLDATKDAMSGRLDATKDAISDRLDATKDAMSDRMEATRAAMEQQQEALRKLTAKLVSRHPSAKLPSIDKIRKDLKKR